MSSPGTWAGFGVSRLIRSMCVSSRSVPGPSIKTRSTRKTTGSSVFIAHLFVHLVLHRHTLQLDLAAAALAGLMHGGHCAEGAQIDDIADIDVRIEAELFQLALGKSDTAAGRI